MNDQTADTLREIEATLRGHARRLRLTCDDAGEARGMAQGLDNLAERASAALAVAAEHAEPDRQGVTADQLHRADRLMTRFMLERHRTDEGLARVDESITSYQAMAGMDDAWEQATVNIGTRLAWHSLAAMTRGTVHRDLPDEQIPRQICMPTPLIIGGIAGGYSHGMTLGAAAALDITEPA